MHCGYDAYSHQSLFDTIQGLSDELQELATCLVTVSLTVLVTTDPHHSPYATSCTADRWALDDISTMYHSI